MAVGGVSAAMKGMSEEQVIGQILGRAIGIFGLLVPMLGISIAHTVIRYMALYDVYTSLDPKNNVIYLVLSIVFSFTEPFFLFFNRQKDEGMPPRKQEPVFEQPVYQTYEEPWNQNETDYLG